MEESTARVEDCISKPKSKWRPLPLDTVELQKIGDNIWFCTLFKGTVCLISRYSKCKDDNVRFTTVLLKPLSEQKCVLDEINNKIYISSSNPEIILFIRKKFHLTGNGYIGNRKLRMSAKSIMTAAEKLYTQGFISYPR